ncbi:hypothetical protein WEI85_19565 [Actinomycetes bacterium KLBMP 9797]
MAAAPDPLLIEQVNWAQYRPGQADGHYESFYQRANHPTRPLAFWIRYTIFSPHGRPADAVGELWAIVFDGETGAHAVARRAHPIARCAFGRTGFDVRVAGSTLGPGRLRGDAGAIAWDLAYTGDQPPVYLLPRAAYQPAAPNAKTLVGLPLARYDGTLAVDGRAIEVAGWLGSQNHNWGRQHAGHYAFGQVAGFAGAPDSFLEVLTTRAHTLLVLRHAGREHALAGAAGAGEFGYFHWAFRAGDAAVEVGGQLSAPPEAFVGLAYPDPPGGVRHCLNTKIGSCELTVTDRATGRREVLRAPRRALFEIVTDDRAHGIEIRA